ncbi:hypothetical protein AMJ85_07515 [candidate division BRC1 bacterium SM23_51]|nr:MAG: hypothetical protein AMJ85_07515 [candidate division BRC1 bacterium SM23_51]
MKEIRLRSCVLEVKKAGLLVLLVCMLGTISGCVCKVIPPETVTVRSAPDGELHTFEYPLMVIVHDENSVWDAHQIKNNIIGLTELEAVRILDILSDILTPGPEHRPIENAIEWIKNQYAKLPPCAPVTIVRELFWAMGFEKLSPTRGSGFFPRVIYLTDWLQITLGEMNRVAGYAIPGQDTLLPRTWTARPNDGVDSAQNGLMGAYIYLYQGLDWCLDKTIAGGEIVWQKTVWLVLVPWY